MVVSLRGGCSSEFILKPLLDDPSTLRWNLNVSLVIQNSPKTFPQRGKRATFLFISIKASTPSRLTSARMYARNILPTLPVDLKPIIVAILPYNACRRSEFLILNANETSVFTTLLENWCRRIYSALNLILNLSRFLILNFNIFSRFCIREKWRENLITRNGKPWVYPNTSQGRAFIFIGNVQENIWRRKKHSESGEKNSCLTITGKRNKSVFRVSYPFRELPSGNLDRFYFERAAREKLMVQASRYNIQKNKYPCSYLN